MQICEKYLPGYYSEKLVSACWAQDLAWDLPPGGHHLWHLQDFLSTGTPALA